MRCPSHLSISDGCEAELSGHESWLETLQRQIEALEAEASAKMILRLGRDRDLRRALGVQLHDQPDLGQRIAEDPRSFFEKRGIEVPDGATVTVQTDPGRRLWRPASPILLSITALAGHGSSAST